MTLCPYFGIIFRCKCRKCRKCKIANGGKLSNDNENKEYTVFTANEVANTIGENYKSVAKVLNSLASQEKIKVTEKLVNNRPLKGYCLTIQDLQEVKSKFISSKHLSNSSQSVNVKMVSNSLNKRVYNEQNENFAEDTNVKFYEVMKENAELTKEVAKLKQDIQNKTNENVRLDADLSMARSELKFIEDKTKTVEAAYAQEKQKVEAEQRKVETLQKQVNNRNIALMLLGMVIIVVIAVSLTIYFLRGI